MTRLAFSFGAFSGFLVVLIWMNDISRQASACSYDCEGISCVWYKEYDGTQYDTAQALCLWHNTSDGNGKKPTEDTVKTRNPTCSDASPCTGDYDRAVGSGCPTGSFDDWGLPISRDICCDTYEDEDCVECPGP